MFNISDFFRKVDVMDYEAKLLSLNTKETTIPKASITYADLSIMISIREVDLYHQELFKLAQKLPFETSNWPSFGKYIENWQKVELNEFNKQLHHCERGSCRVIEDCENIIDLSYHILKIISPSLTSTASKVAESLDQIEDQRLLIWLRMSSEIFHMYQVNKYFGTRTLNTNVTWMCEELVRMGIFNEPMNAFKSKKHILHGLMLSGLPLSAASKLYKELLDA